jgi:hypothetical protein
VLRSLEGFHNRAGFSEASQCVKLVRAFSPFPNPENICARQKNRISRIFQSLISGSIFLVKIIAEANSLYTVVPVAQVHQAYLTPQMRDTPFSQRKHLAYQDVRETNKPQRKHHIR